jgi:Kdo2-lipid IVA lauroyltransferase/acyltransferase
MQFIVYWLVVPVLYIVSFLPFKLLYLFSDCIYGLVFYIIRYRRKTVQKNLKLALPHLSQNELKIIEKKFFKHMVDMFLEMIKTMTISQKEMEKRFVFKNLEEYLKIEKQGKSIALVCAHYASYEWVISINKKINFEGFAIYKRINNKYFDRLIHKIRSKFKANLITSKDTKSVIEYNYKHGIKGLYGFASDQTPKPHPNIYWSKFMGIEVPVHTGAETLSKRFDMNIMYLKTKKVKRGYYEAELELLSDNVAAVPDFQITELFLRKVEQQILEAPEYYLWTHKRWKHMKKVHQ